MEDLFNGFIRDRRYLRNLSERTIEFYESCFKAFMKHGGGLSKAELNNFVVNMKMAGISTGTCNCYIRGTNAFLHWLYENGHSEHLRIKLLKQEKRVMKTFTDAQLKAILRFKPQTDGEYRLHTLLLLLMDTGIRIEEALTLKRESVDLDNLLIAVVGKGNKERIIPFSVEYRKTLFRFLKRHRFDLVFCTRNGGKLQQDNTRRDFKSLMERLGVEGFDGAFHCFRRVFATHFIRNGGNPLALQRILGHQTLAQTNEYVRMVSEDLSKEQARVSILNRLR